MKKIKVALFGAVVLLVLQFGSRAFTAKAAPDFSSMSKRDYILFMMNNPGYPSNYNSYSMYFGEPGFEELHNWFVNARSENYYNDRGLRLDSSYPWELTSDREIIYIRDMRLVAHGRAGDAYTARWDRYNREHGVYEEWERQQNISANRKMWSQSQLVGNPNSHGVLTNKDNDIYQRVEEDGTVVKGTDLGAGSYNMDEPSGVTKVIMEFLCWLVFFLADGIDSILSTGGIALDNVIFGRVAGYGVLPAGETDYITLFGFELTNGNPYGYIGAMLFQRIRTYIYLFMAVYCLVKMVKIAASTDYMKMKMDFSTFIQNALLSFSFIVLMPYIFDVYLYIRDVLLKAVAFDSLQDLFGTTGFLASFRAAAESSSLNIIPNLIYLGAVILSLVVAGIYIAYAMSMMVHFILFPFVCLRGIGDRNAYKEWAAEALGLTIMPLIDGILLIIPLTFSDMADGNLAFNLLSLVSCGMLLTARKQARRSLGIKDTGLDMGAMATVVGLGAMMRGLGKTVGKMGKKFGEAREHAKAAEQDENMADFYENEARAGRVEAPHTGSGKAAPESGISPGGYGMGNLKRHANIDNFENGPFKGNLDNSTMAELYRARARKHNREAFKKGVGALGAGAGGLRGFAVGMGAGAFMGVGAQSMLAGAGADMGSSINGAIQEGGAAGLFAVARQFVDTPHENAEMFSGSSGRELPHVDGEVLTQLMPVNTPTGSGGAADVEVDETLMLGDGGILLGDSQSRDDGFYMGNMETYKACCSDAVRDLEADGALNSNPAFNAARDNVHAKMSILLQRAKNGESPEAIIKGKDGFNELHLEFNHAKSDILKNAAHSRLEQFGPNVYNPEIGQDKAVADALVQTMLQRKKEDGSAGQLYQGGRYMTNRFDKSYGITWARFEQQILSECAKHGYTEA